MVYLLLNRFMVFAESDSHLSRLAACHSRPKRSFALTFEAKKRYYAHGQYPCSMPEV